MPANLSPTIPYCDEPWRVDAACLDADSALFFAPEGERTSKESSRRVLNAKMVCHDCRAKLSCLEWAFRTNDKHAVLGGLTPAERESMLQQVSA